MIIISCFKRCLTLSDYFWVMVVFWTAPVNTLNCKRVPAYKSLTSLGFLFAWRYFIILFSCHWLFWSHANKHTTTTTSTFLYLKYSSRYRLYIYVYNKLSYLPLLQCTPALPSVPVNVPPPILDNICFHWILSNIKYLQFYVTSARH